MTLTATVTETATNQTQTKDYTLTLYSLRQTETENALNAAVKAMTGNLNPVYGTDTNLIDFASKKLGDKLDGIKLTIKEDTTGNGGAGVSKDGTITYYFNQDSLSGSGAYLYVPFVLEKDGITAEQKWYTNLSLGQGQAPHLPGTGDRSAVHPNRGRQRAVPAPGAEKGREQPRLEQSHLDLQ